MYTSLKEFKLYKESVKTTDEDILKSFCDWHINILNKIRNEGIDINSLKESLLDLLGDQNLVDKLFTELNYDDVKGFYNDGSENDIKKIVENKNEINAIIKGYLDGIKEQVIVAPKKPKYDITKSNMSLASAVKDLISSMDKMQFNDIKDAFMKILNDSNVHACDSTRAKWKNVILTSSNKNSLMFAITNLYLKAAKLGVNENAQEFESETELTVMNDLKVALKTIETACGECFIVHKVKLDDNLESPYGEVDIMGKMFKVWLINNDGPILLIEDFITDESNHLIGKPEEIIAFLKLKKESN